MSLKPLFCLTILVLAAAMARAQVAPGHVFLPKADTLKKGHTKSMPLSDMPALTEGDKLKLQKLLDKELALIKQYYDNRHDTAGYARYLLVEEQTAGTDVNDIKRARELVLTNLHIPIPK